MCLRSKILVIIFHSTLIKNLTLPQSMSCFISVHGFYLKQNHYSLKECQAVVFQKSKQNKAIVIFPPIVWSARLQYLATAFQSVAQLIRL